MVALFAAEGLDVENWARRARDALTVFERALAYNPRTLRVEPKSGADCSDACICWPFLGSAISADDAERRALGLMTPTGELSELPDVSVATSVHMPAHLTEEMIDGASLPSWP